MTHSNDECRSDAIFLIYHLIDNPGRGLIDSLWPRRRPPSFVLLVGSLERPTADSHKAWAIATLYKRALALCTEVHLALVVGGVSDSRQHIVRRLLCIYSFIAKVPLDRSRRTSKK